ncbi:hypothetical protein D9613_010915 [Agrocybe pediades]|uniref:C2 NT-type domain-containing protein n=1 Tax=Agrocybe pediades TaxID=84607 RepID=A0A8H4QLF6_9AGAR|nr:hypothetical protein D9613_010915 [Agrocybe pediades]
MSPSTRKSSGSAEDALKSPKPGLSLYLNKPLNGNASSVSVNENGQPPSTPGLRAHIGHLLPKHTYFRAKVTIHQISSVPFVGGEFGVRWKFKGVHTPTGQKSGLLDRVKAKRAEKGKMRQDSTEDGHVVGRQNVGAPSSMGDRSVTQASVSSRSTHTDSSQHLSADWGSHTSAVSSNSSTTTIAPTPISTNSDFSTLLNSSNSINGSTTPARGMTPFLKLKDHSVVWSQTLDTILKFDVDRETSQIMPNPLKLVVMQRVIPDDPHGSPQNPRLGAVYLNLAEYVGQGPVERRYLLKESKTNATLKVTIEMEYISGETHYIPPPLAKGEILTGIAGFLENDVVKKRPKALDIYGPYNDQQELEIDLLGAPVPKTAKSMRKQSTNSNITTTTTTTTDDDDEGYTNEDHSLEGEGRPLVAFDVQRLPYAYGTRTTEALIDALFNPVKTSEKREESPFTIYVPSSLASSPGNTPTPFNQGRRADIVGLGLTGIDVPPPPSRHTGQGHRHESSSTSSMYSTSSSSASVRTGALTSQSRTHSMSSASDAVAAAAAAASKTPTPVIPPISTMKGAGAPEGRVVVDHGHGHGQDEQHHHHHQHHNSTSSSGGGVKGWWKRHTSSRPPTPTFTRHQGVKA